MRAVILSIEAGNGPALRQAADLLRREHRLTLTIDFFIPPALRTADDWQRLQRAVQSADFVFGSMIFGEEHVRPLEQILSAAACPVAMIMSSPALIKQTRLGKFDLRPKPEDEHPGLLSQWLRAFKPKHGHGEAQRQIALVRGMSKMLKYLPGKARDLHSYISIHQYWTNSSAENLRRMLCLLIERYVPGYKGKLPVLDPLTYPETALVHPDAPEPFATLQEYERWRDARRTKEQRNRGTTEQRNNGTTEQRNNGTKNQKPRTGELRTGNCELGAGNCELGTVGLLTLRAIALGGNTAHLDALVRALEARGLEARMAYAAGLDGRPAVETFFLEGRKHEAASKIDLLVNTTGFALVGGPAATRPDQAEATLRQLDVPAIDLIPLVFQNVDTWRADERGLSPMQLALNVAMPELDGTIDPLVYGGPPAGGEVLEPLPEQIELAAERIACRVTLHRTPAAETRLAIVLFNFPPNLGNAGTAAYLNVFASVYRLLGALHQAGYTVELPASADELRRMVSEGNALLHGADGNVADFFPVEEYRELFPHYSDIEPYWGAAPGELLTDGRRFQILGRRFGNIFVGLQPSFGYERDPLRLLMARDAAPHHGFAAFYTWLRTQFQAHAVLHFGTHGALEFMPGKQAGLSAACWPNRLLGGLPNSYYYCVNNPSEGSIARRRSAATLVSYLVPPVQHAGLYKGLRALKDSIEQYHARPSEELLADIYLQAERLGMQNGTEAGADRPHAASSIQHSLTALAHELLQIEQRLIPVGLHVLGEPPQLAERADILALVAAFARPDAKQPPLPHLVARQLGFDYARLNATLQHDPAAQAAWQRVDGIVREAVRHFISSNGTAREADCYLAETAQIRPGTLAPLWAMLADLLQRLTDEQEIAGLLRSLRGGYVPPSPGNDVVRNPAVVPTGRNIYAFDPFQVPTPAAQAAGRAVAEELLQHVVQEQGTLPETVALVLWGTDNIKTSGEGIAQALALLGTRAVADELGRIADIALIPLEELGRPRIDIVVTVSGIFRDLFSMQAGLLDKAVRMAAAASEPPERNFVRKHALEQSAGLGIPPEAAAARIFSNAPGSYGANVNHLVESSTWEEDAQLSDTFLNRKSFAYGPGGEWIAARPQLERALATATVTFQNIDSVENGISDIDHYYEYLGGLTKSVERLRGARPTTLMGEVAEFAGPGAGRVRPLEQLVRLESRAKLLNPKWYEGLLNHGYEGVREIETRVGNTYGWSATAEAVDGWVYQGIADTYLLDAAMRDRMAALNPHATAAIAGRLLEASDRGFWDADPATLEQLKEIYADLEDQLEGVR
jgi:magnesium chelatase subunit H